MFHRPLDDPAIGVSVVEYIAKWKGGNHLDIVHLEVVAQLPWRDEYRVEEFLHLGVAQLGLAEYLTDEVDGSLYLVNVTWLVSFDDQGGADHISGCRDVEK